VGGVLLVLISLFLGGCGTVYTISQAEQGVNMKGSYCDNIDHVFSGVEYSWCKLNGAPRSEVDPAMSKGNFHYVGIDIAFSFIADILVLPYTVYKQVSADPIAVRSEAR